MASRQANHHPVNKAMDDQASLGGQIDILQLESNILGRLDRAGGSS